jgi:hypothetical protein
MNRTQQLLSIVIIFLLTWGTVGVNHIAQATTQPSINDAGNSKSLPDGLNDAMKAALGPNYRPMLFPPTQQAKLLANDKLNSAYFGDRVALSKDGNTALITATRDGADGNAYGAGYIFVRSGAVWSQQAKLQASDKATFDLLGAGAAISHDGNTVILGAPFEDDSGINGNGAVYVFVRSGTTWSQQVKLLANDRQSGDSLGVPVALSSDGNTAFVGAGGEDSSGTTQNGAVYIFTRSGTTWSQQAKLLATDKADNDEFGASIASSGDGSTIIIGARGESDSGTTTNGAVYIYTKTGTSWSQQAKLLATDKADNDAFGISVSISLNGDTALVGAYLEDDGATTNNGAAYIFTRSGTNWTQQNKLIATDKSTNATFGIGVALSHDGTFALIGASGEDDGVLTNSGAAYIFVRSGTTWNQQAKMFAADKASAENFGFSVALSGSATVALVGAVYEDDSGTTDNGAAYTFINNVPLRADTVGVFKNGTFYLRNSNSTGSPDFTVVFGNSTDLPVVGDWNGDGIDTIGVYNSTTGVFSLSDSNTSPTTTYAVTFGNPGDTPFAGKWVSTATHDGIGVYRDSNGILYQKNVLSTGVDDYYAVFGNAGDKGFAGDWNGNGLDSVGVYRSSNQSWYLTNNSQPNGVTFSDIDYVWNISTNLPVVGDWDGDIDSTSGNYNATTGVFNLNNANAAPGTLTTFTFSITGGKPIAGKWTLGSLPPPMNILVIGGKPGDSGNENTDAAD